MEIMYQSSRKKIWNFYWNQWIHGKLKWVHARIFTLVFCITYFYGTKSFQWSLSVFIIAALFSVASVIWMPIFPQIKFKPQTRSLSISERGIFTSINKVSGERSWHEVASITELNGNVYIVGTNGNGFIVPLRAFTCLYVPLVVLRSEMNFWSFV